MISPPPFLVPPVGLPPISSSYTLHSFTPPSLSSLWPPPSSFLSLSTRLVSLRFSPSVSIPLSCSPLVHVRVLIQPVAGLLTNPSFSFIFLTSCSLRRPRSASPSLPPFLPSPPHPSCSTARHAKTSILSPPSLFHGMGRDIPMGATTCPDHIFCIGNGRENKTAGRTLNVARYGCARAFVLRSCVRRYIIPSREREREG